MRGVGFHQVTRVFEAQNQGRLGHGSHAGDDTTGSARIVSAGNPVRVGIEHRARFRDNRS